MTDEPTVFVVLDESGDPVFVTLWERACQEHINEACEEGIDGAGKWVVRKYLPARRYKIS